MTQLFDTVLILALPASGKSEIRKYLSSLSPEQCRDDFHMGPTIGLDDFPYVHMMRRIDQELDRLGAKRVYFQGEEEPFQDGYDWGTLVQLVNEDYANLNAGKVLEPESAGDLLLERLMAAAERAGAKPKLAGLSESVRHQLSRALEAEAADLLRDLHALYPETLEGKTLVVEFARGGPDGAAMPLPAPHGYRHSLAQLSQEILERSVVLYVWVSPEESRRKNVARADPDDPGSILHHGTPHEVMMREYGCDDMAWLLEHGPRPNTIQVEAHGKTFTLPVGRFDNRVDKTSFIRNPQAEWKNEEVSALHTGLSEASVALAGAHWPED